MTPKEIQKRGLEVHARLQNIQRETKEAMERGLMPEALAVAGEDGVKVARAMMITSMEPDKLVILCEGDMEKVVLELEYCVATIEKFVKNAIRQKKEDPKESAKQEAFAKSYLDGETPFQIVREDDDTPDEDRPCTFQFAPPNRLQ